MLMVDGTGGGRSPKLLIASSFHLVSAIQGVRGEVGNFSIRLTVAFPLPSESVVPVTRQKFPHLSTEEGATHEGETKKEPNGTTERRP